jgi:hypothetical protein
MALVSFAVAHRSDARDNVVKRHPGGSIRYARDNVVKRHPGGSIRYVRE